MMARFKPLALPLFGVLLSLWLIYDHWINPDPNWRWPKGEAAGPLFFVIFAPWLIYTIYRAARPYKLAVGTRVAFKNGDEILLGFISDMQGDMCSIAVDGSTYRLNRYELQGLAWTPKVGDRVRVKWADGALYPAVVRQLQGEQVHVQMSDGRELSMSMSNVMKG